MDELRRRKRALVALDLPGHGASGGDWGMSFEGTDAIVAVAEKLGPVDAVVAHSAGCGMSVAAIGEGWQVERAAFIAPPLGEEDRWARKAVDVGVELEVARLARSMYFDAVGTDRAGWRPRAAYRQLDLDLLVVHSQDDERMPYEDTEEVMRPHPRTRVVTVEGLTHRRTARDPGVVGLIADFVA